MTTYPGFDPTALFAGPGPYRHRNVTFASGAAALKRGTLLGRVTASDKYVPCVATATDGSQVPMSIAAADVDVTLGDVVGPDYEAGPFAFEQMVVDASWTYATLEAALRVAKSQLYVKQLGLLG